MNGLLFLLFHRDIGLVFWSLPCEWKALYTILCILKPSTNGGSRTVSVGSDPPCTKATFDWEACNELEAGAERRPGEYLMTKRLRTPLYTTVWLMNAASSQTGLRPTLWGHHLHPCCYVMNEHMMNLIKEIYTLTYGLFPSIEANLHVIWVVFIKSARCSVVLRYRSGTLCLVCWLRVYLQLLLLEMDPPSDLDSADPIKRCE